VMRFRQAIKWLWRNWARISDLAVDISWLGQDCGRWGRPKTVVTKRAQPAAGLHFGLRRSILTPRAHDAREVDGMVHRDIKPSNVMINRDGKAAYD
jgi:hypothetical protein